MFFRELKELTPVKTGESDLKLAMKLIQNYNDTTSEFSSSTPPENYILEQFRQKLEETKFEG